MEILKDVFGKVFGGNPEAQSEGIDSAEWAKQNLKRDEKGNFQVFDGSQIITTFEEAEAVRAWLLYYRRRLSDLEKPLPPESQGSRMRTRGEVEDLMTEVLFGFRSIVKDKIQSALSEAEEKFRLIPANLTPYDQGKNREGAIDALRGALAKVAADEDFRLAVLFGLTETRMALTAAIEGLKEGQSPNDLERENGKAKEESAAQIRRELEAAAAFYHTL